MRRNGRLKETGLTVYRKTLLGRQCEEAVRADYGSDEMKTPVHLSNGGEAIPSAVLAALPEQTSIFGTYRNHALYIAATENTDAFFAELYGKKTGCAGGKAGSMHMTAPDQGLFLTSAVVATTIPVAVGAALAHQYRGSGRYVAVFFGDGAMEEGSFWESLNFACLRKLRIFFICENNELAIHAHIKDRQAFTSPMKAVGGFDCYASSGKGYEPEAVYRATTRLRKRIERHTKPAFLYLNYHRYLEHVGINEDYAFGYRKKPASGELTEKDPVVNAAKWARALGATDHELGECQTAIDEKIRASVMKAKRDPHPLPEDLTKDVFN